jgi:hypothetical protein
MTVIINLLIHSISIYQNTILKFIIIVTTIVITVLATAQIR